MGVDGPSILIEGFNLEGRGWHGATRREDARDLNLELCFDLVVGTGLECTPQSELSEHGAIDLDFIKDAGSIWINAC